MLPKTIKNLIEKLAKLPEVGPRQATRLIFWLLKNKKQSEELVKDLKEANEKIKTCQNCFFVFDLPLGGESTLCAICRDKTRDRKILAIVEKETDLISLEQSGFYRGLYFVLGGLVSKISGNEKIRLRELANYLNNLKKQNQLPKEILIALAPTSEGDLTFEELKTVLQKLPVKITRLGRGLPRGSQIEFTDPDTLGESLKSRK